MASSVTYDWTIAKDTLTAGEKDRLLCIFLNSSACTDIKTVNWATATKAFESKSADSMKVSFRNALAKIEKAGGKIDEGGAQVEGSVASAATTAAGPKKRKAREGGDGEEVAAPKTKKPRGWAKAKKAAAEAGAGGEGGDEVEGGKGGDGEGEGDV